MPAYRVFRLKEHRRQYFRWAPHISGVTQIKRKDYEEMEGVESPSAYSLWAQLRGTDRQLNVGDVLELENGETHIFKYVGFEDARWAVLDPQPGQDQESIVPAESSNTAGDTEFVGVVHSP